MRRPALALLFFLAAGRLAAQETPAIRAEAERLHLSSMPLLLALPEIQKDLAGGLTTSFVFEVTVRDARGARASGGALVEIRYELWDEVYLVEWRAQDDRHRTATLASQGKLFEWWQGLDLAAVDVRGLARDDPWQVKIRLSVLPFSSAEQRDAQRWFTGSVETQGSEAGSSDLQLADVINLMIATSIGRESSLVFDWKVALAVGGGR